MTGCITNPTFDFQSFIEIVRNGMKQFPSPQTLVGDWSNDDKSALWKTPEDMNKEKKYLRDCDQYSILLKHFCKAMVGAGKFRKSSKSKFLSEYMGISLEAFLVVTYLNNYEKWMDEAGPPQVVDATYLNNCEKWKDEARPPQVVDTASTDTGISSVSFKTTFVTEKSVANRGTRWTEKSRGAGKDKGWPPIAQKMHIYLSDLIKFQREQSEVARIAFESGIRECFFNDEELNGSISNFLPDDVRAMREERLQETLDRMLLKRSRNQYEYGSSEILP
jgi:hypothetical protein